MKPSSLISLASAALAVSAGAWVLTASLPRFHAAGGASTAAGSASLVAEGAELPSGTPIPLADDPIAPHQRRLLDLAFTTASALPLFPHLKDRSRAQEEVVEACLELGQIRAARAYADEIVNWRKGAACAEIALCCVQRGAVEEARACLAIARDISDDLEQRLSEELEDESVESPQDWHRDRIRVKMAKALLWHGEEERAAELEAGVVESESGQLDAVRAMLADGEDFETQIRSLEALVTSQSFERARHALEACVQLFDRFYGDPQRRARAEEAFRTYGARLPGDIHIRCLREAAESALAHEDRAKALELVEAAQARLDGSQWLPEHRIPLMAALAGVRYRAGDEPGAEREIAAALSLYEAQRENILDFYRAEALAPLAEAACATGDVERALELYRRALEEGARNPNSRPRAEDLTATCLSMALHALEPDDSLWQRILQVRAGLGEPW